MSGHVPPAPRAPTTNANVRVCEEGPRSPDTRSDGPPGLTPTATVHCTCHGSSATRMFFF